uniref:JmjC domain-containing protein n=1 Tax=Panagrolaimus superbus TaxID=310955 RepID=A0A914Y131_9BILA
MLLRKNAPVFYPSNEEQFRVSFIQYLNKEIISGKRLDIDEVPLLLIKLPEVYNQQFLIDKHHLSRVLNIKEVRKFFIEPRQDVPGIYDYKFQALSREVKEKEILQVLEQSGEKVVDPVQFFKRKNLQHLNPTEYWSDLNYSHSSHVYQSSTSLPPGWNIDNLDNQIQDIFQNKDVYGVNRSTMNIGNYNTSSAGHRDDFMFGAVSYVLPESPYSKLWIAVHQKHVPKLTKMYQKTSKYSSCVAPILHKDSVCDLELLAEAGIPYYFAECKPGYMAVVLPAAWHQVYNPGPNVADAVNFICHRWEVAVHREYFNCCKFDNQYYNQAMWKPIVEYFQRNESPMGKQWKKKIHKMSKQMDSSRAPAIEASSISQDLFAEESDESATELMEPRIDSLIEPSQQRHLTRLAVQQIEAEYQLNQPGPRATAWVTESQQPIVINLDEIVPSYDEDSTPPSKKAKTNSSNFIKKSARKHSSSSSSSTITYSSRQSTPGSSVENHEESIKKILQRKSVNEKQKNKSLQDHYDGIVSLSSAEYVNLQTKLADQNTILHQIESQHKLHNALKLVFGKQLILHKNLQGYVSYEIARDYIDGRGPNSRLLFKTAIQKVDPTSTVFWNEVTANEASWNRTFLVDKNFRIPAHCYH